MWVIGVLALLTSEADSCLMCLQRRGAADPRPRIAGPRTSSPNHYAGRDAAFQFAQTRP